MFTHFPLCMAILKKLFFIYSIWEFQTPCISLVYRSIQVQYVYSEIRLGNACRIKIGLYTELCIVKSSKLCHGVRVSSFLIPYPWNTDISHCHYNKFNLQLS